MAFDFTFTEEHEELRATVRAFLAARSDEQTVRALMATERGYDPAVWTQMAEQLGLAGLIIPEEHGGAGYTYVELLVAMEEMGAALLCSPFLGTSVFATNALLACANETTPQEAADWHRGRKNDRDRRPRGADGRWDIAGVEMQARAAGDGFTLDGAKSLVLDGHTADVLLVVARTDAGPRAVPRRRATPRASRASWSPTLDITRKLANLEFSQTPATRIGTGDATAGLEKALAKTLAALSAEQVGGAQKCLELATQYAKERLQFGRPIGSYQAIKHKCADMLVGVEFAKSAAYNACFAAAEDSDDLAETVAMAQSYCSEAYFHAAADNIQIHGGMGFTWEHPAHLYFKRAKASDLLFGDAAHHREVLAGLIDI